jgi:hypothetical protein
MPDQPMPSTVPAEVRAALQSAGISVVEDHANNSVALGLNGLPLAIVTQSPPEVIWADANAGRAYMWLIASEKLAKKLRTERGLDTFRQRDALRQLLQLQPMMSVLADGHLAVRKSGGLTTKDFYITDALFGEFARLTVLRGQDHIVDVSFSSPKAFMPLSFLSSLKLQFDELRKSSPPSGPSDIPQR